VAGLLVARIALSAQLIGRPGLQFDETLFVNAATLRIRGDFIAHSAGGIPLMVFPYIGALKSWLYDPLFAVFGTSAASIRLPVVLITSAGLVLAYLAVRDLINRPVALLAFGALCLDASIFWLTRDDVGPSAIELFLKCAALWCCARFARAQKARWVWVLLATLALGVFNKLSFIWVVNAAVVVSAAAMFRYRSALRAHLRAASAWVGGLAVIYAGFGAYYVGQHVGNLVAGPGGGSSLGQPWSLFESGMRDVLSGTWFYNYALGSLEPRDVVVVLILALFAVGAIASVASRIERSFAVAGMAVATLLIALQNFLTMQATAGWHYVAIYPFVTIVAAYGAYRGARAVLRRDVLVWAALAGTGALALAYDGALLATYERDIASKEPINPAWSPAIYSLSDNLQHTRARIFTADWGISNPLFALHPSRRYTELAFALRDAGAGSLIGLGRRIASSPGPKLLVTHPAGSLLFHQANRNLFAAVGNHLHPLQTITGRDGAPVYLVYIYH
jgi:4-amino-4-deoxy-L-arabinose transferase-like glycosyltransferase